MLGKRRAALLQLEEECKVAAAEDYSRCGDVFKAPEPDTCIYYEISFPSRNSFVYVWLIFFFFSVFVNIRGRHRLCNFAGYHHFRTETGVFEEGAVFFMRVFLTSF